MALALSLGQRNLGATWPNPAVGCVIVRTDPDGFHRIVGRGWTEVGGRPHAEALALAQAGEAARGATAYVSLEPCSHRGETPPCADALVQAGIARAVVAMTDPDARVDGRGIARLRSAGIAVEVGVDQAVAAAANAGFVSHRRSGRPLVTLKLATSVDGRIATHTGESQWITGPVARRGAHALRARHDAVMVGLGTALADDPLLTARLAGLETLSPVRILLDRRLRLPLTARMIATAREQPTWVITLEDADAERLRALEGCGVVVIRVEPREAGQPDLGKALESIADRGITRLMVEGGARLAAALMSADLVDRLIWFRASGIIGGDGVPALAGMGVDHLADQKRFRRVAVRRVDDDLMESYERIR